LEALCVVVCLTDLFKQNIQLSSGYSQGIDLKKTLKEVAFE
jgi:hypothetical protein